MNEKNIMNTLEVSIVSEKIKMYIDEENNQINKIKKICSDMISLYTSSHQTKIINNNQILNSEFDKIIEKRPLYISTLTTYINAFDETAKQTVNKFSNVIGGKIK